MPAVSDHEWNIRSHLIVMKEMNLLEIFFHGWDYMVSILMEGNKKKKNR